MSIEYGMDYFYKNGDVEMLIETIQNNTRSRIIEQYIQCRKKQRLTQAELADRVGVPRTNITRFESGSYNPSLEMMVKIATALGTTIDFKLIVEE